MCKSFIAYLEKQKPVEWSEEDNIGWDEAFVCVTRAERAAKNEEELQNAVTAEKWLKEIKFKYSVYPVKKEWSEGDKEKLYQVIETILADKDVALREYPLCSTLHEAYDDMVTFLKSLPERFNLQPKQGWSEEDERMLSRCVKSIETSKQFADSGTFKEAKDKETSWLKDLLNRFNLQPKQEWSEEDERDVAEYIYVEQHADESRGSFLRDLTVKQKDNRKALDWMIIALTISNNMDDWRADLLPDYEEEELEQLPKGHSEVDLDLKYIRTAINESPTLYAETMGSLFFTGENCVVNKWARGRKPEYCRNITLITGYEWLEDFGYRMSDEERAYLDGTLDCYAEAEEE